MTSGSHAVGRWASGEGAGAANMRGLLSKYLQLIRLWRERVGFLCVAESVGDGWGRGEVPMGVFVGKASLELV